MLVQRTRHTARVAADSSPVETGSTLVYILGIGFMIYVGLEFVLPALFGATAKTRHAYRAMKTGQRVDVETPAYNWPT